MFDDLRDRLAHIEDFPGAARVLTERALVLQRTATPSLTVCEQVRRRR